MSATVLLTLICKDADETLADVGLCPGKLRMGPDVMEEPSQEHASRRSPFTTESCSDLEESLEERYQEKLSGLMLSRM